MDTDFYRTTCLKNLLFYSTYLKIVALYLLGKSSLSFPFPLTLFPFPLFGNQVNKGKFNERLTRNISDRS